ncbi:MAG TPA: bifunctional DNA primase/polymerase [Xanthobacteraceae bacterium]|nr:bifunctional DNA primase/polymerase [Xanthobacteraceae bacterium]
MKKGHRTALAMAAKGFRVFPCKPNSKEPACRWRQEATTDPAVIRGWSPEVNYGVAMDAEHFVLDLDCKGNTNGRDTLGGLEIDYDAMPATFAVRTPSGGEHLYLIGNAPNSVRKKELVGAIDVRGDGGYVIGPGSMIDGKPYEIIEDHEIAAAPDWLLKLAAKTSVEPAKRDPNIELDTPGEISRTRNYLTSAVAQGDVAIEFCGGNDRTYKLFNAALDHVSPEVAYDLVAEVWNPACVPPWSDGELRAICASAVAYRQNEIGSSAKPTTAEAFSEALANLPAVIQPSSVSQGMAQQIFFSDLLTRRVEPVEEIIPGLVEKGIATMLSGPGGTHKSRVALQWGHCIDAGIPIFGRPVMQSKTIYLDYENGVSEMTRRTQKMNARLKLPSADGQLFDLKRYGTPMATVSESEIEKLPWYDWLENYLCKISGHKFIVADSTYNILRFTGQAKINETMVKEAINLLDNFCTSTDSTMLFLWHPSQAGQERGDASGWSVAWHNAPRARLSLTKDRETPDAFKLKVEKRNNGPEGAELMLHWRDGVLLPLSEIDGAQQATLLFEACISAALKAYEFDAPIQKQKHVENWLLIEIEKLAGFKPSQKQIKDQLATAMGKGRLRYLKGFGKQTAGYYPPETDPEMLRLIGVDTAKDQKQRPVAVNQDESVSSPTRARPVF